ncbi:pectinesterase-like [Macadamia integrifolia]|uniref:pectinesterase-like n=1 Tax=Macadamia integrifolia TaxID=60698 RepID=UPI001C4E8004|nr:pectinesterase-like [Macadamia integrifolia]
MVSKAVVAGVSLILVVGVVVGVVTVTRGVHSSNNEATTDDKSLVTGMKAVKIICEPTSYKDVCERTISGVANNASADPKDFIKVAVSATLDEIRAAMDHSAILEKDHKNGTHQKNALEDCKELLQFSIDELQESISVVEENDLKTVNYRVPDLANWLSAVVSYQVTCLDGINHPKLKSAMEKGLHNSTQLTSNALAIIVEFSKIFMSAFNIPLDGLKPTSRRLLHEEATQVDSEGYAKWLSAADRKLLAVRGGPKPNAVVAKDGSGQFKTIAAALAAYPKNHKGRYIIYVKAGIYDEYIIIDKHKVNVFMYGDGPRKTIVTGNKNRKHRGYETYRSATFSAIGYGFLCKSMGFRNTAGPTGEQAVALRVQSDYSAFINCRMDGYQDTLYVQTHRQFYRNCVISGTVDFIFGDSATMIQNSLIIVRKPLDGQKNTVTAQGREDLKEPRGIVIQNCRIVPEQKLVPYRFKIPTYLGRPWKKYAITVIMESQLADFIHPDGWLPWNTTNFALDTCYCAEYGNRGPGAKTDKRVRWKGIHIITDRNLVTKFTAGPLLNGSLWLKNIGAPYDLGFTH